MSSRILGYHIGKACPKPFLINFQESARRSFHSYEHPSAALYTKQEDEILASALSHVPVHGFTKEALNREWELIRFHFRQERSKLQSVQLDSEEGRVGKKIRKLCISRLMGNEPYIKHFQDALAIMALPANLSGALRELHELSDEMWHLANDKSADMSWYTKRASLSSVYATTEMFMSQDESPDFNDTIAFLDRRLHDVYTLGSSITESTTFVGFQLRQVGNILASKGLKF